MDEGPSPCTLWGSIRELRAQAKKLATYLQTSVKIKNMNKLNIRVHGVKRDDLIFAF
jgi:hypothetical protein